MKTLKLKLGYALCILLTCVLVSCNGFSTRTCHLAAKEYVREQGYAIDTAMYYDYRSYIFTKDSTVIIVDSHREFKYPYVNYMKVVRKYAR